MDCLKPNLFGIWDLEFGISAGLPAVTPSVHGGELIQAGPERPKPEPEEKK